MTFKRRIHARWCIAVSPVRRLVEARNLGQDNLLFVVLQKQLLLIAYDGFFLFFMA